MTTHDITLHTDNSVIAIQETLATAFDIMLYSLSDTSKRQYRHTFTKWAVFADDHDFTPSALSAQNLIAFLESEDLAHSTKSARLSHLRKLLETMHAQEPDNVQVEAYYKQVQLLKIKRTEQSATNEREKKALKPSEIYEAFKVWAGDKLVDVRNRAILAVAFYGGLRRSEIAALTWDCIDYDNGTVLVKHGKGDKERTVPFFDDKPLELLREWQDRMMSSDSSRRYIFCGIKNKGQGELRGDKPAHTNTIYYVIRKSGDFAPHDARRTLITALLNNGASVADTQFIAGHANPSTTLNYAQVKDAKEVKGRLPRPF